jgi:hypothetical protein
MADAAYNNAMTAANDTAISGYISATGSLLSAAGGFMKPSTTGGGLGGSKGYTMAELSQKTGIPQGQIQVMIPTR